MLGFLGFLGLLGIVVILEFILYTIINLMCDCEDIIEVNVMVFIIINSIFITFLVLKMFIIK